MTADGVCRESYSRRKHGQTLPMHDHADSSCSSTPFVRSRLCSSVPSEQRGIACNVDNTFKAAGDHAGAGDR